MITRSLTALREQHRIMEQQYKERLHALRSELRALQGEHSSTASLPISTSALARERRRSPSPLNWPPLFGDQRSSQLPRPPSQPITTAPLPAAHVPVAPASLRAHARYVDNGMIDTTETIPSRVHSAVTPRSSYTPPPLRHTTSSPSSRSHPSYLSGHHWPQGASRPHRHRSNDITSLTRHDPSLSPTATLVGSDAPSRSRSIKARS